MSWSFGKWNEGKDGSAMKVSHDGDSLKTERISSRERPHSHDIVKVERSTGRVKEISHGSDRSWRKK
jgi:hypothetical protein